MPVPGSGLGSSVGIAEEATWGTPATVTRFIPHNSINLKYMKKPVQGMGLQAGAYVEQGALRADVASWVAGDLQCDFTSKQMGLLLKHSLGAIATAQQGTTTAYTHTATLGSTLNGKGLTVQVGAPQTNGTVTPYTFSGCKITSWDISCAAQDIVKYKATFIGQQMATTTALATASYPTASNVFHFKQASLNVGGTPYAAFRDFTLTGDNVLAQDRLYIGNNGQIAEPVRKGFAKVNFKGTADFIDTTLSAAYVQDTELSIVVTFQGAKIVTGTPNYYETLTITLNGLRVNSDMPTVASPDLLNIPFDADALSPISGGIPIQIDYTTLDATP